MDSKKRKMRTGKIGCGTAVLVIFGFLIFISASSKYSSVSTPSSPKTTHKEQCLDTNIAYWRNLKAISAYAKEGRPKLSHSANILAGNYYEEFVGECSDFIKETDENGEPIVPMPGALQ